MAKDNLKMDKMGYFTIEVLYSKKKIIVRQHNYAGKVRNTLSGKNAKIIYNKLIKKKMVTDLYHAAYLGRELEKASLALKHDLEYIQDESLDINKKRK